MNTYLKMDVRGIHELSIPALILNKGIIILNEDITSESANRFIQNLLVLCLEQPKQPIKVLITTNGGNVDAGMLIYDAIRSCVSPVYTYVLEKAYSMGAVILSAGQKAFMLPNSRLMIHRPQITATYGTSEDLEVHTKNLKHYESALISVFSKRTGMTEKEIKKAISYDHYYSAEEALACHFIDGIAGINDILESEEQHADI